MPTSLVVQPTAAASNKEAIAVVAESRAGNRRRWLVVAALLFVHAGLLAWVAWHNSPSLDEVAHLPAGMSIWKSARYDLYRVNPPLVRMVAAAPVMLANPRVRRNSDAVQGWERPEWGMGLDFVAANGERSFWYFTLARWACLPFSLVGGYFCYRWAKDLYGYASGIMALSLWCFSPNIIANASMITPDAAAAAIGVLAGYAFWRWLEAPRCHACIAAGLAMGLALLTKSTWVILFAIWPVLWVVWLSVPRGGRAVVSRRLQSAQLVLILALALYLLNLGYRFSGSMQRLGDYSFISQTLAGPAAVRHEIGNRFAGTRLAAVPIPFPGDYVLGIDAQKSDLENADNSRPSYLRGEWSNRGWWYYYLYALAIKVPLGTWCLLALAIGLTLSSRSYSRSWRDELVLLIPAAALLILVSSQTGFNRHLRYVLPCVPFALIWISKVAQSCRLKQPVIGTLCAAALCWSIGSSLWIYPHSLSYFNELSGGPKGGHAHLIDSNIDWGQDLLYLKEWYDEHPEARPFHLAYFGYVDPHHAGIEFQLPPQGPVRENIAILPGDEIGPQPGWFAVSVNFLRGYQYSTWDADGRFRHLGDPYYAYFLRFQPVSMAGYSIYIYHLTVDDVNRVRAELGLPNWDSEGTSG